VTSYDKLLSEWKTEGGASYVSRLLAEVPRDASFVTVMDGHPATLSWLGSVHGHRVSPLGVQLFGQTGDIPDVYRWHGIDTQGILEAATRL
jgi:pyruvate dehydrogenase E1 component